MVTVGSVHYAVKADAYYGLSTDTKPTGAIANGSCFVEMDTSCIYVFDAASSVWVDFDRWGNDSPRRITFAYNRSDNI